MGKSAQYAEVERPCPSKTARNGNPRETEFTQAVYVLDCTTSVGRTRLSPMALDNKLLQYLHSINWHSQPLLRNGLH